jgi:hypothetical protein
MLAPAAFADDDQVNKLPWLLSPWFVVVVADCGQSGIAATICSGVNGTVRTRTPSAS